MPSRDDTLMPPSHLFSVRGFSEVESSVSFRYNIRATRAFIYYIQIKVGCLEKSSIFNVSHKDPSLLESVTHTIFIVNFSDDY